MPIISAKPQTPPTTPPAMAPTLDDEGFPDVLELPGFVDEVATPEEIVVTVGVGTRSCMIDARMLSAKPA